MGHKKRIFDTWNCEGTEMPYLVSKDILLGPVRNFEVREDDVWLCTYPKSGTHWTLQILNLLEFDGDFIKLKSNMKPKPPGPLEKSIPNPDGTFLPCYKYFEKLLSPRIIVTHLPITLLPVQVFERKAKVIYIARNPKDVAVSTYHFIKPAMQTVGMDLKWDDFLNVYMSDKASMGRWSSHVLPFWKCRNDENILFLKYEDMKTNPFSAVTEIANFIGKNFSEDILKKVLQNLSLEKTKELMDSKHYRKGLASEINVGGFVRKGIIGDWKTHFTVAQNQHYDSLLENELKYSDLVMQFE